MIAWLTALALCGQNPVELGAVRWQRDYDKGLAATHSTGRPMLLLFQEVPG